MNTTLNTKEDCQGLLLSYLNPLKPYFSKHKARIKLQGAGVSYDQNAAQIEAFARPLWGLIPYWLGGGKDDGFAPIYQEGLAHGTDPEDEEYWGTCRDNDQRFVEMAPIAMGILLTPEVLWDPLSDKAKRQLATWLLQINSHSLPKCNWYFFRIIINIAMRERHIDYNKDLLASDIALIDSFYLKDGWYRDGISFRKDYYIPFAMHFYPLLLAAYLPDAKGIKEKATRFTADFRYFYADTGEAIPYGRSQTYRFGQSAFWSAGLYAGLFSDEYGRIKGLLLRNLRAWSAMPIADRDGILSIGYGYPNLTMAEKYNATGSPYWCLKAFFFLALPDDHPFWKSPEEEYPEVAECHTIPASEMLIQHTAHDAIAFVKGDYNQIRLGHFTEKYAKFAYSAHFGFSVSHSNDNISENAPDSMLSFFFPEEENVCVRKHSTSFKIEGKRIISTWSPCVGIDVETTITITKTGHERVHIIQSDKECIAYDAGFSIPLFVPGYATQESNETITASTERESCTVQGEGPGRTPFLITPDPNTNLIWKNTVIPAIRYEINKGRTILRTRITTTIQHEEKK